MSLQSVRQVGLIIPTAQRRLRQIFLSQNLKVRIAEHSQRELVRKNHRLANLRKCLPYKLFGGDFDKMHPIDQVVIQYDSLEETNSLDIVYLHGRGSNEREVGYALTLFGNARVRSYRGPLVQSAGFAWFENAGIGEAVPESMERELARVGDWIEQDIGQDKPVICGFSNGASMAASLFLNDPDKFSGLAMIAGCIAVREPPMRNLVDRHVLLCRGRNDFVIPAKKFEETFSFFSGAGASLHTIEYEGGHEMPLHAAGSIRKWFAMLRKS